MTQPSFAKVAIREKIASFDEETLDGLVKAGIDKHTLTAAKLIPLIAVAWSDDKMESNEVDAIVRAARAYGIEDGSDEHTLLQGWLRVQPSEDLFETWKGFIAGMVQTYSKKDIAVLKEEIVTLSINVAEAAGGFLRILAISAREQQILTEIKRAFKSV